MRKKVMPKIVFIEPKAPNLHIYSQFSMPRLGIFVLATMMKKRNWDVEICFEEKKPLDFTALAGADLVGITTITPTAPRAYAIADRIRGYGIPVIMGGSHVTYLSEEALEHADFVVRGEGERALMALIDAWEAGSSYENIPSLSYRKDGKVVHNPMDSFETNLDRIPFPDKSLLLPQLKTIAGQKIIPVQTSRGCPFNCSFCSVTGMFGKKYRYRSLENILEELRQYNSRKFFIFFVDDNFTANRKRAKELLEAMIREKFKFQWSTQVRTDVAKDEELVNLMKKARCRTLYIGLESVNPESLKAMKKGQTVEEITRAIEVLKKKHINIHGMFVYGFDADDWKTVKETVRFAKRIQLNSSQFLILTPFPGCEFYDKMVREGRLAFHDWNLYDAHHVVFRPKRFTFRDLQKAQIFSHQRFYSMGQSLKKMMRFRILDVALARYARNLNRTWKRRNRTWLKAIDLLTPGKGRVITLDYREEVIL
jgi:radical SAM superfamily enzyme YgiQ (UPF0313 family)